MPERLMESERRSEIPGPASRFENAGGYWAKVFLLYGRGCAIPVAYCTCGAACAEVSSALAGSLYGSLSRDLLTTAALRRIRLIGNFSIWSAPTLDIAQTGAGLVSPPEQGPHQ